MKVTLGQQMTRSGNGSKLAYYFKLPTYDKVNLIRQQFYRFKGALFYRFVFRSFGSRSVLYPPLLLVRTDCISVGRNSLIRDGVRIEMVVVPGLKQPLLTIGDNVNIEQSVHIICRNRVTIGSNVSITAFCSIVDVIHPIDGLLTTQKVGDLIEQGDASVEIGDGAFIGMGARIHPGVRIGRGAVIGANAVVTRDVPDYHVAAGIPATIRRVRSLLDITV
jgi:acetyltransferase-like isoleucine patch superfamily enzyme